MTFFRLFFLLLVLVPVCFSCKSGRGWVEATKGERTGWNEGLGDEFGPSRVNLASDYEEER